MRKAILKVEKSFYTGLRVAYSDIMNELVLACHDKPEYTGLMDKYRSRYMECASKEAYLERLIHQGVNKNEKIEK